jgi:hypothetical protein
MKKMRMTTQLQAFIAMQMYLAKERRVSEESSA